MQSSLVTTSAGYIRNAVALKDRVRNREKTYLPDRTNIALLHLLTSNDCG